MTATRNITISHKPDGKAITLDELAAFVQDALRAGASGSEIVKVSLNWGSSIKRIDLAIQTASNTADADRVEEV